MTAAEALLQGGGEIAPRQRWPFLRSLLRKKLACAGIVFIAFFYLVGIFAPVIAPHDPAKQNISVAGRLQGPSSDHWFGTDRLGRDLLSRDIYATRITVLFTVVVVVTGGFVFGVGLGLLAGYRGGWPDTLIMRAGEIVSGLPTLILILAFTAAFRTRINSWSFSLSDHSWLSVEEARNTIKFVIIAVAALPFSWVGTARVVRSQALVIREASYVEAAELMGASTWRILTRHVFPGILPLFLVGVTASMGAIAGTEIGLSYLGLGIEEPTPSFGSLILSAGGPKTFATYPHLLISAATPVILFYFSWNLLGDALVDLFEPRLQRR